MPSPPDAAPPPPPPSAPAKVRPFDVVVVTSPDERAALAARELVASSCGDFSSPSSSADGNGSGSGSDDDAGAAKASEGAPSSSSSAPPPPLRSADGTLLLSSCDPFGARMGSGGGTVAALAEADEAHRNYYDRATRRRRRRTEDDDGDGNDDEARVRPPPPTVLICHAGGESSRCPTQIALGKAWTSLPVVRRRATARAEGDDGDGGRSKSSTTDVSNPTSLLISSLSEAFRDVPRGSVIVAASDVLLSFGDGVASSDGSARARKIDFDDDGRGRVIGLAVPAPLSTARNHGVFVLDPPPRDGGSEWRTEPTRRVLQKPTASEMSEMKNPACAFRPRGEEGREGAEPCAWIDTGVVAFLPRAAGTLRELSRTALRCCTRRGLEGLHEERCAANGTDGGEAGPKRQKVESHKGVGPKASDSPSLEEFARSTAQKICLYGDVLHRLRTSSTERSKPNDRSGCSILASLSEKLARHDLYTCAIPDGSFVHLGTTGELVDFLTLGASGATNGVGAAVPDSWTNSHRNFGRSMGLTRRSDSFVSGFAPEGTKDCVVLNSVLVSEDGADSVIGEGSVVEHARVECSGGIEIGKRCLLSGVRGSTRGSSLRVPSGMCLQMLPLRRSAEPTGGEPVDGAGEGARPFVFLCFGVEDGIKDAPPKTLFGLDSKFVLRASGLVEDDLWDATVPPAKRTLWNARINPVLHANGEAEFDLSFLDWIECLKGPGGRGNDSPTPAADLGLRRWREARRLSLSEVRGHVDSAAEARYRGSIPSEAFADRRLSGEVTDILMNRRHEPCNFDYILDFVSSSNCAEGVAPVVAHALEALDAVASNALNKGGFDIVGRTFMTMSMLLSEVVARGGWPQAEMSQGDDADHVDGTAIEVSMKESIAGLRAPQVSQKAINSIASTRDSLLESHCGPPFNSGMVEKCRDFLERAASATTERCVSGNAIAGNEPSMLARTPPVPVGATAVASAPARIDLAGGWSDTPPISYEYGGAVACLAVLVDGKRPLGARCRVARGGSGIRLRTESRTLDDESLVASAEVVIHSLGDMADYCNPMAKCALLKCALIQLGLVPLKSIMAGDSTSIQSHLKAFCQTDLDDFGLEITSQSLLPTGSGMGSSSILGGCILAAIARCVGIKLSGMEDAPAEAVQVNDSTSLIYAVLMLEQILTTGGGWQDNIGGLVGGLKLGTSDARVLPLQTKVRRIDLSPASIGELNRRLALAFSGKPRLAKNILQNVLRRWAGRSGEITGTVERLVEGASEAISRLRAGDLDGLGGVVNRYWQLKIAMAGADSGVEPDFVRSLLDLLASEGAIAGGALCGAGGGGFLAMLASRGNTSKDIEAIVERAVLGGDETGLGSFRWHSCTVSEDGLLVNVEEA